MLIRRLLVMGGLAVVGVLISFLFTGLDIPQVTVSPLFFLVASSLLAVGLFGSTFAIPLTELREHTALVVRVITIGVVLKAALIAVVMYAIFREPFYIVLAVAMAQIDPLAVAALQRSSRLSERGRTVLSAWSSFDDPITTVLVVVFAGVLVWTGVVPGDAMNLLPSPGWSLVGNLALFAVACLAWWGLSAGRRAAPPSRQGLWTALAVAVLLGLAVGAVWGFLMLGLAAAGLVFRPAVDRQLEWLTTAALAVATVLLGVVLGQGVSWASVVAGVVLGLAAYLAQAAAAVLLARSLSGDVLRLALSQQSGITAIILALLLEPVFPGSVAVIGPAILVVNLAHLLANGAVDVVARYGSVGEALRRRPHVAPQVANRPGGQIDARW
jgi:NhaP-type Na+/H+ or K+/H+ antiporter